jgi:glycerol-3-phosphate acyltransferase PlsY
LGKGAAPVLVAGSWYGILDEWATEIPARTSWLWLAVGVAPLVGHMASVFLRFRGGKGVATAFGALLAMWPTLGIPAVIAFAAWLLVVGISRIVSLASMMAAVTVPIATILLLLTAPVPESVAATEMAARMAPPIIVSIAIASLVLWRHRANLRRLLSGDEPRVGQ